MGDVKPLINVDYCEFSDYDSGVFDQVVNQIITIVNLSQFATLVIKPVDDTPEVANYVQYLINVHGKIASDIEGLYYTRANSSDYNKCRVLFKSKDDVKLDTGDFLMYRKFINSPIVKINVKEQKIISLTLTNQNHLKMAMEIDNIIKSILDHSNPIYRLGNDYFAPPGIPSRDSYNPNASIPTSNQVIVNTHNGKTVMVKDKELASVFDKISILSVKYINNEIDGKEFLQSLSEIKRR